MAEDDVGGELIELDDAEYSAKSEFSKAAVIQAQVMRCNELRSKEMMDGHTIRAFDKQGNYKILDIPDTRQPYIGAVIALEKNLTPEMLRKDDKDDDLKAIKKRIDDIKTQIKSLFDKYKHKELVLIWRDKKPELAYSGVEFLPKKGAVLTVGINKSSGKPPSENKIEGFWDNKINAYWDEMVLLYDELFAELHILIDHNDYFRPVSGW